MKSIRELIVIVGAVVVVLCGVSRPSYAGFLDVLACASGDVAACGGDEGDPAACTSGIFWACVDQGQDQGGSSDSLSQDLQECRQDVKALDEARDNCEEAWGALAEYTIQCRNERHDFEEQRDEYFNRLNRICQESHDPVAREIALCLDGQGVHPELQDPSHIESGHFSIIGSPKND